jgi:hypothetical protein
MVRRASATNGLFLLLLVVALLFLALLVYRHGRLAYPNGHPDWDNYSYIAMAEHPFSSSLLAGEPPFCWRILTPLIVHALPVSVLTGFWTVTVSCLILTAVMLYWLLLGLGVSSMSALFGALCFVVLAPATEFNLWDYMLTDPLSFFLLTASMACAIHRKWFPMFAFCILLSFSKELALPAAVFAVLWSLEVV